MSRVQLYDSNGDSLYDGNGDPLTVEDSSAPVLKAKTAPPKQAKQDKSLPPSVSFFTRGNKSRMGGLNTDKELADIGSLVEAAFPSVQGDKSFMRNAVGGAVDALSMPGRAAAATPALLGVSDEPTLAAFSRKGARKDQDWKTGLLEDVVRDPSNIPIAMLSGPSGIAARTGLRVATGLGGKTAAKLAGKLVQSEVGAGLPMAVTGAARAFADDRDSDIPASAIAPVVMAPVADATLVAGAKGLGATARGAEALTRKLIGKWSNLGYVPLEDAVNQAASTGEALSYDKSAGWRSAQTINDVLDRIKLKAGHVAKAEAVHSPMASAAKAMLRSQVKPAPMAKHQAEAKGWDAAMSGEAGNKLFDQLTSYGDIGFPGDGVTRMAERGLRKSEELNRAAWAPIQDAASTSQANYNQALIDASRAGAQGDPNWSDLISSVYNPHDLPDYAQMIGVKPTDVYRRAQELSRGGADELGFAPGAYAEGGEFKAAYTPEQIEAGRAEAYGLTEPELRNPLKLQFQRYLDAYGATSPTDAMDPVLAHKKKALQQARAYAMGDPRQSDIANKQQAAAAILSQAHNEVLDAALRRLSAHDFVRPLPPPVIKNDVVRAGLADLSDALGPNRMNIAGEADPSYEIQKRILAGEQELNPAELSDAVKQYVVNREGLNDIEGVIADKHGKAFPSAGRMEDLTRKLNELLERRGQAPSQGPVSASDGTEEISEAAKNATEAEMRKILDAFQTEQISPWIEAVRRYKDASGDDIVGKLRTLRNMDKVTQPWFQIEPALLRASQRAANKNRGIGLGTMGMPVVGGLIGTAAGMAGNDSADTESDFRTRVGAGALTGAGLGLAVTRLGTPAGAKAVRDLGRVSYNLIGKPATRSYPKLATTEALLDLIDWSRLPSDSARSSK